MLVQNLVFSWVKFFSFRNFDPSFKTDTTFPWLWICGTVHYPYLILFTLRGEGVSILPVLYFSHLSVFVVIRTSVENMDGVHIINLAQIEKLDFDILLKLQVFSAVVESILAKFRLRTAGWVPLKVGYFAFLDLEHHLIIRITNFFMHRTSELFQKLFRHVIGADGASWADFKPCVFFRCRIAAYGLSLI